jgi:hypothetical protein
MANATWDTTFHIPAEPAAVFEHLADPHSYVGLSPLVVEVRDIHPDTDDLGRPRVAYVAVERFRFARILHHDNLIKVVLTQTRPGQELLSEVRSPGWVRLTARVMLTAEAGGTGVTESVDVTFPAPLRGFVTGQARAVAAYRANELTRRLTQP